MCIRDSLLTKVQDPEAKASDLNVARQFLKDNHIEGLPVDGSPLSDLIDTLPNFKNDDEAEEFTELLRH